MNFDEIILKLKPQNPKKIAVVAAHDDTVLNAINNGYKLGFITPILCGNAEKIVKIADAQNIDISNFEIINCENDSECANIAVELIRNKRADILMKGLIPTADLLRAVLNRETGIRGNGILSHVSVLQSPLRDKPIFMTDVAMVTYPDLSTKVELINNAVKFARAMGLETPLVAALAAVEVVNPNMPATIEANELKQMNKLGEIKNCIVDGPLAFDLAVSSDAAEHKGYKSDVAGNADVLLFHNIEAGNSTLKAMTHFGGCLFGGIVMGALAPIVLNSRSDSEQSKLYSIACACSL